MDCLYYSLQFLFTYGFALAFLIREISKKVGLKVILKNNELLIEGQMPNENQIIKYNE